MCVCVYVCVCVCTACVRMTSMRASTQALEDATLISAAQKFRFVQPFECANPFVDADTGHEGVDARDGAASASGMGGERACFHTRGPGTEPESEERGEAGGWWSQRGGSEGGEGRRGGSRLRTINLTDAGVHFNAPFPAVLRPDRRADVIICLDARCCHRPHFSVEVKVLLGWLYSWL